MAKAEGVVGGVGFSEFFSQTIKQQHLKFSIAVRLSLSHFLGQV